MKKKSFWVRSAVIFTFIFGIGASVHAIDDLYDIENLEKSLLDDAGSSTATPASSGSSVGDADIERLFGTFQQQEEEKPADAPKRVLPPFTGTYKVLVSRPIYAVFETETRTKWIAAIGELYAHYKVASFPRTHVFTMEQVGNVLPNFRDYSRRFNRQHYIDAARKLGATHLLLQEYQPDKGGRKTRYVAELYWLEEAAAVERVSVEIDHARFEDGLYTVMSKIAEVMDQGAKSAPAMGVQMWGRDAKAIEQFGNALADEGKFSKESAMAVYAAVDRVLQRNSTQVGFQYAAALLAGRSELYEKAIQHIDAVISRSGDYPALQLRRAEYLRGAARYSEAMSAVETAARNPALRVPAAMEMAMIHQSQGNLDRARAEYDAILQSGDANGRVFFQLALLSIQTGRISESEEFIRRAEESGFALDEDEYFDLGEAYSKAGDGYETQAIEFLRRSMGVRQNREDAWLLIAEINRRIGNDQLAADAYVNVFKINWQGQGNSGRLKMAGEMYERLGMTDKAKDAYSLFIDRRFDDPDVSMSLARIYFNEGDCNRNRNRLESLLRGLDTIPEAADMMTECGIKIRRIDASQTVRTKKLTPLMATARYGGLTLLVGGIAGGLIVDRVVIADLAEKYGGWPTNPGGIDEHPDAVNYNKVKDNRKKIESNETTRNILYIMSGVGLAGFAVSWFF